ncbi:polymer-forming cytoskeletal protein [Novosphingobium sp. FKTRR1]|uniref:bactofilin family protein n=1 Tax=unclassified Novosphingobium TaxID=2644732 RepID=UPI001CF047A4|nr:polymer-forming cytoskeletal protein [Novosphingobium sp. FKTRR1]
MFSKKPGPDARPVGAGKSVAATFSVLGADLVVTGDITAAADLHIDGRIEGDVTCASLVQGESGTIHGAVRAQTARLAGRVEGAITVTQLVLLKSARIHGDVTYDSLTIEQGAQVDGRLAYSHPTHDSVAPLALVTQQPG